MRDISKCKSLIVLSDKTFNFYEVSVSDYKNSLNDNITKDYENCTHETSKDINEESKNLTSNLKKKV